MYKVLLHGGSGGTVPTSAVAVIDLPGPNVLLSIQTRVQDGSGQLYSTATLSTRDSRSSEKWKKFKRAWTNYSLATKLRK